MPTIKVTKKQLETLNTILQQEKRRSRSPTGKIIVKKTSSRPGTPTRGRPKTPTKRKPKSRGTTPNKKGDITDGRVKRGLALAKERNLIEKEYRKSQGISPNVGLDRDENQAIFAEASLNLKKKKKSYAKKK